MFISNSILNAPIIFRSASSVIQANSAPLNSLLAISVFLIFTLADVRLVTDFVLSPLYFAYSGYFSWFQIDYTLITNLLH